MTLGVALVGAPRGITYEGEWPTRLKDCLKCHNCGYSESIAYAKTYCEIRKPSPILTSGRLKALPTMHAI